MFLSNCSAERPFYTLSRVKKFFGIDSVGQKVTFVAFEKYLTSKLYFNDVIDAFAIAWSKILDL